MSEAQEWVVLETYRSQSEARVVESFLTASGFEVQLLDALGQIPARGLGGMRLLVRAKDENAIRARLAEAERGTHLDLVDELGKAPPLFSQIDRTVLTLLVALAVLGLAIARWLN